MSGISFQRKLALSFVMTLLIGLLGGSYQFYYLEERGEYERAVKNHYVKIYGKEPEDFKLRHLATMALDRYGPTEFYRNEEDYERLFEGDEK